METNELKSMLTEAAKKGEPIHYEDIAPLYGFNYDKDADRAEVGRLLGIISEDELDAGRPMLSAVVVLKGGEAMPGKGFFDLARRRGRFRGGDEKLYWVSEFQEVCKYWQSVQPDQ